MASVLSTYQLACGYGSKTVVSNVNVEVLPGTLTALVGLNGSGKSTLLYTLAGLQQPLSGEVRFKEQGLNELTAQQRAMHVGVVLTKPPLIGNMTVWNLIALGRYPHTDMSGRLGPIDREIVVDAMTRVGLEGFATRPIAELSDGERQKAMIARALAQSTDVILLDEPTAFLDAINRVKLVALLKELVQTTNKAVVFSTHDLNTAFQIADRLWITHNLKLIDGNTETLIKSAELTNVFTSESVTFDPENCQIRIK